jgi:sigma-B regulation protein RsbU (phosphoserine phosphatase)
VTLGTIILASFLVALALSAPFRLHFVRRATEISQAKRTFLFELGVCLFAGVLLNTYNLISYDLPLFNTISMMVGCAVAGFFIGLDSSLARERYLILQAMSRADTLPLPKRLFSMTRKFSFVALTTALFVALVLILVFTRDIVWLSKIGQDAASIAHAQMSVTSEIFFIMVILMILVVNLIISYSRNLRLLFNNETRVLEQVSRGNLAQKVPVATNDEFGLIAGHTNNMIDGLRHRIQLISALKLAEELQQNLLPRNDPQVAGLDMAGASIYCDETGGDYYDYFNLPDNRLGIVVADASGHGVGAAIHMATVRAFLHFAIRDYQGPARLLSSVNTYVTRDSSQTGNFMSLFFLEINPKRKSLRWVRAGHEPALVFEQAGKSFAELDGKGMALGVDENFQYDEFLQTGWNPADIILIGTDGIHESRNEAGAMFGQERLRDIIRRHADASAKIIRDAVLAALRDFRGNASQEDDVTLVVVKLD